MSTTIGFKLAHPEPGEAVVITGLSGRYPDADDTRQFAQALYDKVDLVSDDTRRWFPFHDEIPQRTGKVNDIDKLDYGYFGLPQRHACYMDPMMRLGLEKSVEAVIDAGVNPSELEGTATDVYMGICSSETEKKFFYENMFPNVGGVIGCARSLEAQRITYHLKLKGKSYILDSACSSSVHALNAAYESIRTGKCEQAIVAGINVCLSAYFSLQFARLGMLSPEGKSRVFDNDADGYVRSEAGCAIFLQKEKDARRVYGKIVHSKVNCDGYKPDGITYPSGEAQAVLLKEFYQECGVAPEDVSFVEAHGTGTKVGDPEEVIAIDEVFCKNRNASKPLPIGAVKSNIGHTEPVSLLCSLTKVIYMFEYGYIPPNINFKTPRLDVEALQVGRIRVVTEKEKWNDKNGLVAINNFGFGGANGHVLLQKYKTKLNDSNIKDDIPRLVCVSGRTLNGIQTIADDIKNQTVFNVEYIRLYQEIFRTSLPNELYRGFMIVTPDGEKTRSISGYFKRKEIGFYFDFITFNASKIIKDLCRLDIFKSTFNKISSTLRELQSYDILNSLMDYKSTDSVQNMLLNVLLQIGLVDIMKGLEIEVDFYSGNFIGSLACAYFEDILSVKDIIKIVLKIAEEHKSAEEKGIKTYFAITEELTRIIPPKIVDSSKWKHFSNSKLTTILINSLIHREILDISPIISEETILICCGANPPIRNKKLPILMNIFENENDAVYSLLVTLGRLYQSGVNAKIDKLYPKLKFPVSSRTPMISPLIKWCYPKDLFVVQGTGFGDSKFERILINTKYNDWAFISEHVINGRNLFPAAGYIYIVMDAYTKLRWKKMNQTNLCLENVKFIRATNVPPKEHLVFDVTFLSNGDFLVTDKDGLVVSGTIYEIENPQKHLFDFEVNEDKSNNENYLPLLTKDVYKELRLRGYNYMGHFKGIIECSNLATSGKLQWEDNWITFIDSMLQMQILQEDTRTLYVPTVIQEIVIQPDLHFGSIEDGCINVKVQKSSKIIRAGGVQIRGISCAAISKRKPLSEPVIESHCFIPNETEITLENSIRVIVQIILENNPQKDFRSFEIYTGNQNDNILSAILCEAVNDLPLINSDIKLFSDTANSFDLKGIVISDISIESETNQLLVIGHDLLKRKTDLMVILNSLETNGFVLSRESDFDNVVAVPELILFTKHKILNSNESLFLMKKRPIQSKYQTNNYFEIPNYTNGFSWVDDLKSILQLHPNTTIISKNRNPTGILGFINCLRKEPGKLDVQCLFLMDEISFNINEDSYQNQLKKGMSINILKNSKFGTYRHLLVEEEIVRKSEQIFAIVKNPGDFSSLTWIEGPLKTNAELMRDDDVLINIYYSSLNFRDVLTALGRIPMDAVIKSKLVTQGVQGFEFAGRDQNGKRVIGMYTRGAFTNLLVADKHMLWDIPDHWTMEDAATVPVVYATVLYGLKCTGGLKKGSSILVHSGAGGIGQATINIALHSNCTVFTTVGSKEKRDFLLQQFPNLNPDNIGNSRDISFEDMIRKRTEGHGVDYVLNSLTGDRLFASLRCVKPGGHFLEIGKFDLINDAALGCYAFRNQIRLHGIMLDLVFGFEVRKIVQKLVEKGIRDGVVKPLNRTVFPKDKIEEAFRYMATGKHFGKIIINIREEEKNNLIFSKPINNFETKARFYCNPESCYIIVGGLGGFGMELADWLVTKGCKKLVLVSRNGLSRTGYHDLRIRFWKKYVDFIKISTADVTTKKGCSELIKEAGHSGPVEGIFNLAVVLRDGLFEDLTTRDFRESVMPKAVATKHLDEVSRELCPKLKYFVVFSSVSCGRGNYAQTNYGWSNSVMERICEQRKRDGYPALAVQWGAIGDVGLVANMNEMNRDVVIGGTLQQGISSCLQRLDHFLCHQETTIISSMVVAEKRAGHNVEEVICNILGIKDMKTINLQLTLFELGMDSITGVEIKQLIERDFDITLLPKEMKSMTFLKLRELSEKKRIVVDDTKIQQPLLEETQQPTDWLNLVLRNMKDIHLYDVQLTKLPSVKSEKQKIAEVHFLPGIEGMCSVFEPLSKMLECEAIGYQFLFSSRNNNMQNLAEDVFKHFPKNTNTFNIIAYSFGCMVGLELVDLLEQNGNTCNIIFIDGAPEYFLKMFQKVFTIDKEDFLKSALLTELISSNMPTEISTNLKAKLLKCPNFEERMKTVLDSVSNQEHFSREYLQKAFDAVYDRLQALKYYQPTKNKLKSKAKLFRPVNTEVMTDYGLSEYFQNPVEVNIVVADHVTILHHPEVIEKINSSFSFSNGI